MKEIVFKENQLDVDTYLALRESVGWRPLTRDQAGKALANSMFTLCAYVDGKPAGMGRVVGDGAVICYIQDLIRDPKASGIGLGRMLMKRLIAYVQEEQLPGTEMMLDLMCAKGRERFYESLDFIARPTPLLGPGMIQYLYKEKETK